MQAVILMGGLGTRLRPLTDKVPKGLVEVGGRPFLEYQLLYLARFEIRDIILCTGYLGDKIQAHFQAGSGLGVAIRYSREEKPLGTGGALKRALPLLDKEFFLLNGDTLLPTDYGKMQEAFAPLPGLVFFSAFSVAGSGRKANLKLGAGSGVTAFSKTTPGADFRHADSGVTLVRRGIADFFPEKDAFSLEEEVYPSLIASGKAFAWEIDQKFYDIGTPAGLKEFEDFIRDQGKKFFGQAIA